MTEQELESFEAELRQIKPGRLPDELINRLQMAEISATASSGKTSSPSWVGPNIFQLLRWLIPATAAILITAVIWRGKQISTQPQTVTNANSQVTAATAPPLLKADNIEIGKELVSSFDAVATLPSGEPVRFRCQQWRNKVVVDDKKQGLLVENSTPRVVVVPVGFETY